MIPVDIELTSYRVQAFDEKTNDEGLQASLDLLEEVRDRAQVRMAAYQQRASKFYNSRIKKRSFRVGDLVLCKVEVSNPKSSVGKLSLNWEIPL